MFPTSQLQELQRLTKIVQAQGDGKVINEGPGDITSDSLAAESLKSGGSFADGKASASSQPSASTTSNTTDTSAANVIPAAQSKSARDDDGQAGSAGNTKGTSGSSGTSGTSGSSGLASGNTVSLGSTAPSGSGELDVPHSGNTGGSAAGSGNSNSSSGSNSSSSGSYASATGGQPSSENQKPKGDNVTEGGFDSSAPNASFNNDIGGKNDPGRVAEQGMARSAAESGAAVGDNTVTSKSGLTKEGAGYEALGGDAPA